jgi:23S rRNA (uracil1939-C5)-methyltransferase
MTVPAAPTVTLPIERMGRDGEGVGRLPDGRVAFVAGALPGETVQARIVEEHAHYVRADLIGVDRRSPDRRLPPCPVYGRCGGCTMQHWSYEAEAAYKAQRVRDALVRIAGVEVSVAPIRPAPQPYRYRTKAAYPWTGRPGAVGLGLYARRSHQVVVTDRCLIQDPLLDDVLQAAVQAANALKLEPYDEAGDRGLLRHLVVRASRAERRTLALVVTTRRDGRLRAWAERLMAAVPHLVGVAQSVQHRPTNRILGGPAERLAGWLHLEERVGGFRFQLAPDAFFQVNPDETEQLLEAVAEAAGPSAGDIAWDLYAGVGVLASVLARAGYRVTAVESEPAAVASGRQSAQLNALALTFVPQTAEAAVPFLLAEGSRPTLVTVDPPRSGLRSGVVDGLLQAQPDRLIYVSCDPETLARDVARFKDHYTVASVVPVDLFPRTDHVETVLTLERRPGVL